MIKRDTTMLHNVGFKLRKEWIICLKTGREKSGLQLCCILGYQMLPKKKRKKEEKCSDVQYWHWSLKQNVNQQPEESHIPAAQEMCWTAWECAVRSPNPFHLPSHVTDSMESSVYTQLTNRETLWYHLNTDSVTHRESVSSKRRKKQREMYTYCHTRNNNNTHVYWIVRNRKEKSFSTITLR